jgi:HSP20 family protein
MKTDTTTVRTVQHPRVDVHETAEALELVADLPGVREEALELTLEEDVLTLRAPSALTEPEGWSVLRREFEPGDLERRFRIGTEIDPGAVSASFAAGQLRVTLPRRRPARQRIEVRRT